jgi:hypothetical protein
MRHRREFVETLEGRRMLSAAATAGVGSASALQNARPISVAAASTTIASPTFVTAAALSRSHQITITWRSVSGATGYRVEHNDGTGWTVAGQVGTTLSFEDTGLKEQATYRYRVSTLGSGGVVSAPSKESSATTALYRLFDGTLFQNRPDPVAPGIETLQVAYQSEFYDWKGQLNKTQVQDLARRARDAGRVLAIDIEGWHVDKRYFPLTEVDKSISDFNMIFSWIRQAAAGVKFGVINLVPTWPPNNPNDPAQMSAWRDADDYLWSRLSPQDYVFTGLYAHDPDPLVWENFVEPMLNEARRFGKPVYHFMSMQSDWTGQLLSPGYNRLMLAATRRLADGAVMWGGSGMTWDASAPWFKGVQDFLNEPKRAPAATPTLSMNPLGARLSWTTPSADVDGLFIERSTDGVNFSRYSAAPGDATSWLDNNLKSGTQLYYRLAAVNGFGATGYSNVVTDVPYRDGAIVNQAESVDDFFRDQRAGSVIATANVDWFRYRDVHFDGSPTQLVVHVGVPPENDGQHLVVRLDAVDGPIIGDYQLESGLGWGDAVDQTIPISGASGVHDVYFTYAGGTVASMMDYWKFQPATVPANPTRLKTRSIGPSVELTWRDNAGDETGYRVERAAPGQGFSTLVTLPPDSNSYSDTSVQPGVRYRYRVVGTSGFGDTQPTNIGGGRGGLLDPYQRIEAEATDDYSGVWTTATNVQGMGGYDWIRYFAVDFGDAGAASITMNVAVPTLEAGQSIQIRLDAPDGPIVGNLVTTETSHIDINKKGAYDKYLQQWNIYGSESTAISGATGIHELYIVGTGNWPMGVGNIDWIQFTPNAPLARSVSVPSAATTLTAPKSLVDGLDVSSSDELLA